MELAQMGLWVALGFTFARSFGKRLDQEVQQHPWFLARPPWFRGILKRLLDFLHHWWVGLLLYFYSPWEEVKLFGLGIFIDDWPDIPRRFRPLFSYLLRW